ncbi:MAG: GtrA family protein [Saprospiraceae bacterium]
MSSFLEHKFIQLFLLKAKYATTSAIATLLEYLVFGFLKYRGFTGTYAHILSYACGMVFNFMLQKLFIFDLKRSVSSAFLLAMMVSFGGMALSTGIFVGLTKFDWFFENDYVAKLIATGIVFFYNFYLKRFVFEKKFI